MSEDEVMICEKCGEESSEESSGDESVYRCRVCGWITYN